MNRRVLFISIGGAVVIILLGVAAWLFLTDPVEAPSTSSGQETPFPIDTGTLPVISTQPLHPTDIPQPSGAPIAFQGVCSDTWIGQVDTDVDGLPDAVEATYGTDANVSDTDGDEYSDSAEIKAGYHPLDSVSTKRLDSDDDGLLDNEECTYHTDAFNPDSDSDGFHDGVEVKNGYDPARAGDGNGSDRVGAVEPTPGMNATTPVPVGITPPAPVSVSPNSSGQATQALSNTPIQISLIPLSQLKTTASTAVADVKTYLTQIDGLRPQELADGQAIASAIQSAATGNVQPLSQARSRIAQFSAALKGVSTPKPAQEYQQLYVSLIDFTVQQLQAIEQNATGDQAKAAQAVLNIQNTLPSYVTRLSSLRQAVEGASNQ